MSKERSRAYPILDLESACQILRQDLLGLGFEVLNRETLASRLGYSTGNGGVAARKIAALVHYGFLKRKSGAYRLSRSGRALQVAESGGEEFYKTVREALGQPALFRRILSSCSTEGRIPEDLARLLEAEGGITAKASAEAAEVFFRSAHFAGVLSVDGTLRNLPVANAATARSSKAEQVPQGQGDTDRIPLLLTDHKYAWLEVPRNLTKRDIEILRKRIDVEIECVLDFVGAERTEGRRVLPGDFGGRHLPKGSDKGGIS